MKRTLHMIGPYPQSNNGVSDYMAAYIRSFREKGYRVIYTKIYFLESKLSQLKWLQLSWRVLLKKRDVYLVQYTPTISGPLILFFLRISKWLNRNAVVVAHEMPETYLKHLKGVWVKFYLLYEKYIFNWSRMYVVHTLQHQKSIAALKVIGNPCVVPIPIYGKPIEPVRRDQAFWAYYGQISPKKGVDLLLEAYQSEKPGSFPQLKIIGKAAPGNDAYVRELREKVQESHRDVVQFAGFLSDEEKDKVFRKITLMIFPYRWVSQSGALVESCRYRIPYLASNLEYFKGFNRSFGCGALFETESVASLVGTLKKLAGSPINIPQKEFENLFKKCSLEYCAEQLERLF